MPANYPPIAPRGPSAAPVSDPVLQTSDNLPQQLQVDNAASDAGQAPRLAALEAAPAGFIDAHHPVRDAVAIALQKPAGELIKRHAMRQRLMKEAMAAPADSDDPTEPGMTLSADDGLPAILAMAETQVAQALLGDAKAFNAIADRVEGKAGLRKADLDAATEAQRRNMQLTIETLVRDMGEQRMRQASDRATDVAIIENET